MTMRISPNSAKDARARSRRKLKALKRRAFDLLCGADGVAGMFEEGPVSSDIDALMREIEAGIEAIEESMTDEVTRELDRDQ